MMSLGAGALKVSRGPNGISREEVSTATLESGNHPKKPVSMCLENGGTHQQGDLVPPITQTDPQAPNNSPSCAKYEGTNLADPPAEIGKRF